MARREEVFDTLRLSNRELQRIVSELERRASGDGGSANRDSRRWSMQTQRAVVTLLHPNGQKSHMLAVPRNLSRTGIAFVCGNYIHLETPCLVTLRSVNGQGVSLNSVVKRCRHIDGRVHDIGVHFKTPVDPRDFMIETGDEYLFHSESVDIAGLNGRVLIVCPEVMEQRLLGHYFADSSIDVMFATTGEQALSMLEFAPDMVLVEMSLPDMSGFDFIGRVRQSGLFIPLVLMTAEQDLGLRQQALAEGATELLFKPMEPALVKRAVAEYLVAAERRRQLEAETAKEIEQAVGIGRMARQEYATELRRMCDEIASASSSGDMDTVRRKILAIKSSAAGFGFPSVGKLADATLSFLTRVKDQRAVDEEIGRFVRSVRVVNAA